LGYRLNEYSLRYLKDNKRIKINSEKDVFDILGIEYVLPKDR
jgi:DNA polymerase/3'-5' exonuclease PolX